MARDSGYVTVGFVGSVALTLVGLVAVANLLLVRYAEGVLHAAVESGVRQALATGSVHGCEARVAEQVRTGLGSMADGVGPPVCRLDAQGATARLHARFPGWLPLVPPATSTATATAAGLPAAQRTGPS